MQNKEQKKSPIKQRILSFAKDLGISKREFYTKIGVSRGTLESNTGITEEVLAKFIATYPKVDAKWLLTGEKGELVADISQVLHPPSTTNDNQGLIGMIELQKGYQELLKEKDVQISHLISVIEKLSQP